MENIEKLQSWDTQLYADCVEFCPFEPVAPINCVKVKHLASVA